MVFTCKDQLEDILTCIYDAWVWALKNGHDKVRFEKEPVEQMSFLDEYMHVSANNEKMKKVIRSIQKKISYGAYKLVYFVFLSKEEDSIEVIYNFLRLGFKAGAAVLNMYTEPVVARMMEIRRNISNEISIFTEKSRFTSIDNKVYVSHIEPRNYVLYPVAENFADRMPSENWMIIDDNRRTAVVHPKNGKMFIQYLTEDEFNRLQKTEEYIDEFVEMWKTFFDAIAIKERENYNCQRSHFPIWTRKHVTEFKV